MKQVLVTGAAGFVGDHVVRHLSEAGNSVICVGRSEGDVAEIATWERYPVADAVVHLAARTFVPESWRDPYSFIRTNAMGTAAALHYCRLHRAHLIYVSSYLYGNPDCLPIPETAPVRVNNPYGLSKKMAEEACVFAATSLDVQVTILRPFNIYGPAQGANFLIPEILGHVKAGREIVVKDLAPRRDYVYVADVASAIGAALTLKGALNIFNVGTGVSHSVGELISLIQSVCGTDLPVCSTNQVRQSEISDTVADISEARRVMNWTPRWDLRRGLSEIVRLGGTEMRKAVLS